MRDLRPGDKIFCQGLEVTIKEIAWQEPWEMRKSYYLEFWDTAGTYRSWKQGIDGGYAVLAPEEEFSDFYEQAEQEEYIEFDEDMEASFPDLEDLLQRLLGED